MQYIKLQTIGFMGPAVTLICLNYANTPTMAATLLTAALSLSSFSQAGFMLNIQVSPAHKNLNIIFMTFHELRNISVTFHILHIQDIAPQYAGILHGKNLRKCVWNVFPFSKLSRCFYIMDHVLTLKKLLQEYQIQLEL